MSLIIKSLMYNANKSLDRALDTVSGSKSSKETLRGISSVSMNSLNFLFISSPEQLGQKKQRNTRQKGDTKIDNTGYLESNSWESVAKSWHKDIL
jgi:hypothetical protein